MPRIDLKNSYRNALIIMCKSLTEKLKKKKKKKKKKKLTSHYSLPFSIAPLSLFSSFRFLPTTLYKGFTNLFLRT